MKSYACFLYLSLVVVAAVVEAGPAPKTIGKESPEKSEPVAAKESLKIEEIGEEKDRSKKAAICLQLEPQENHLAGLTVPQQVPCHLVQPQPNFVVPQQIQQQMVVPQQMPQQMVVPQQQTYQPSVHKVQYVHSSPVQPCTSSINVIQTVPEGHAGQTVETPRPRPTPSPEIETFTEKPTPAPMRIVERPLPPPRESYSVLPMMSYQYQQPMASYQYQQPMMSYQYQEPMMAVSGGCTDPNHGLQCTCRQVQPMSAMSAMPYSSYYTRSPVPVTHSMPQSKPGTQGPQARKKTYINVNIPPANNYYYGASYGTGYSAGHESPRPYHVEQTVNQEMYVNGVDMSSSGSPQGISMSAFPRSYRSSDQSAQQVPVNSLTTRDNLAAENHVEADDLVPGNKSPREIGSGKLSSEKIERKESRAAVTDSKLDTKNDKREASPGKKQ